jgi:hydroxymethylbilane synthase
MLRVFQRNFELNKKKIIIATRGSKLALCQAELVKSELLALNPDLNIELKEIKTTGDKILDAPLAKLGGKGLFVKEIEEALLRGKADLAVHSVKDIPVDLPEGLHIKAICKREDPRDAFIAQLKNEKLKVKSFNELPEGATIGTSSLRRASQIKNIRPDLNIIPLRGNLDTRLKKLDEGKFDAIILAYAGVKRLGLENRITELIEPSVILPAIGQGAIGIECRVNDEFINKLIALLNHEQTSICVQAERAFLKKLEGGCQVPIAAYAVLDTGCLIIEGLVGSISGDKIIKTQIKGNPQDAEKLGIRLAEDLLSKGAKEMLDEIYGQNIKPANGKIGS